MTRGTQSRHSWTTWQDGRGRECGGFRREGTCVCLWPIHADEFTSQYCNYPLIKINKIEKLMYLHKCWGEGDL